MHRTYTYIRSFLPCSPVLIATGVSSGRPSSTSPTAKMCSTLVRSSSSTTNLPLWGCHFFGGWLVGMVVCVYRQRKDPTNPRHHQSHHHSLRVGDEAGRLEVEPARVGGAPDGVHHRVELVGGGLGMRRLEGGMFRFLVLYTCVEKGGGLTTLHDSRLTSPVWLLRISTCSRPLGSFSMLLMGCYGTLCAYVSTHAFMGGRETRTIIDNRSNDGMFKKLGWLTAWAWCCRGSPSRAPPSPSRSTSSTTHVCVHPCVC